MLLSCDHFHFFSTVDNLLQHMLLLGEKLLQIWQLWWRVVPLQHGLGQICYSPDILSNALSIFSPISLTGDAAGSFWRFLAGEIISSSASTPPSSSSSSSSLTASAMPSMACPRSVSNPGIEEKYCATRSNSSSLQLLGSTGSLPVLVDSFP